MCDEDVKPNIRNLLKRKVKKEIDEPENEKPCKRRKTTIKKVNINENISIKKEKIDIKTEEISDDEECNRRKTTVKKTNINKNVPVKKEKVNKNVHIKKEKIHLDTIEISDDDGECNEYKPLNLGSKVSTLDSKVINIKPEWSDHELLSEQVDIDLKIAKNLVNLFEEGNTIPFIARYRRNCVDNLPPETLREARECFEEISELKSKIKTVVTAVEKAGKLDNNLKKAITCAKTLEQLEHIYAPYKPGRKRTLAERAKELGLEEPALTLLENKQNINLMLYIQSNKKELSTLELVEKGVKHIIASIIATDIGLLELTRTLRKETNFTLESKKLNARTTKASNKKDVKNIIPESKYETYFNFNKSVKYIKPHQVLAMSRGEAEKILSVKIIVPENVFHKLKYYAVGKWVNRGPFNENRKRIINEAIQDSYTRLIEPLIIREVRSELKIKAEKASYEVFCTNLKHLLLIPPVKGKPILGIDPGFSNGCKLAVISITGLLLDYDVVYHSDKTRGKDVLKSLLLKHNCSLIALGNGTACRETENWLCDLIKQNYFAPLKVSYTIVNEDGASIYSCSPEARKEFPSLDVNIISAVSLARRIQEPLAELVKVEPKHLGVGMYQHDLKKKRLEDALNEVVSECVSFVGVDLNTASQCLLSKIAGLTDKRAAQIIEYREKNGPFICRKQLLNVKGIGKKAFEQCAGFLRVGPMNPEEVVDFYKKPETTKLDCTYIHPESYTVAFKIIKKLNLNDKDIGNATFINTVEAIRRHLNMEEFSSEMGCDEGTANLIINSLCKPLNYDLRMEIDQTPLFRKSLTNIEDIHPGTVLTGRIKNVTHFGCFVDVGVGKDGLIHSSGMNGYALQIGDKVEVKVKNIEVVKKRIGLQVVRKL